MGNVMQFRWRKIYEALDITQGTWENSGPATTPPYINPPSGSGTPRGPIAGGHIREGVLFR